MTTVTTTTTVTCGSCRTGNVYATWYDEPMCADCYRAAGGTLSYEHRVYEPGIGSEGNHLDVRPYVMDARLADGIPTVEFSIVSPEGVREGPGGDIVGCTEVHIRVEDIPALVAALHRIVDISEQGWHRVWRGLTS
jgi:hypothetical protein